MKNILRNHQWLVMAILTGALLVSVSILADIPTATAQSLNSNVQSVNQGSAVQGITFPIPELGNCASESECHIYCNNTAHMDACVAFAQAHGLMNKDDASNAKKFKAALQSGSGPGGCTNPQDCQAYCGNPANLEACVKFAKDHGVNDANVQQAEKILAYTKSGGHMPGDCNSQTSCQTYCGDFSHAEECAAFAKNAGITQGSKGETGSGSQGNNPTPEQLQKLTQLAQSGQTPGGCTSKGTCETYCNDQTHRDECVAFGVKAGFMTQAQADTIKSTGGNGPGGCNSSESCQAYCNDSAHQADCLKFGQDHGFINKNDQQQIQNGIVQVRSGLMQAPPEVVACIKSSLNPSIFDQIESGKLVPGPDVGKQIQACFNKFRHTENPSQIFTNLPDQALSCVKSKLGSDFNKIQSGAEMPTPEMADTIRVCFQSAQIQQMQGGQGNGPSNLNGGQNPQNGSGENFQNFLQTAPPEITPCLQQTLGADFDKVKSGAIPTDTSMFKKAQSCFSNFQPKNPSNGPDATGPQNSLNTAQIKDLMAHCVQNGGVWDTKNGSCNNPGYGPGAPDPGTPPYTGPIPSPNPTNPSPTSCPQGQYWNGSSCINSTTSPSPTSQTCPSGQYWSGTSCMTPIGDPSTMCAKSGGTWTGTTCKMP